MSLPATGGAPASAPATSSAPASGQGAPAPGGSGGHDGGGAGDFDYTEFMREAKESRRETREVKSSFDKKSKEFDQTRETLERVKKAFAPEESEKPRDPVADLEEQMDFYLEQAMEARARGKADPTSALALKMLQQQIESTKAIAELRAELAKSKGAEGSGPDQIADTHAYGVMENHIGDQLDSLYGQDKRGKSAAYQAVCTMLNADLQELKQKAPQKWAELRRNPSKLAQVVQAAIKQIVPPRAMQILDNERIQNTPISEGELWAAFRELKEQKGKMDPNIYRQRQGELRRDILQAQEDRRNPRGAQRRKG